MWHSSNNSHDKKTGIPMSRTRTEGKSKPGRSRTERLASPACAACEALERRLVMSLTIVPTFDPTIINDPQAATIEASIDATISRVEADISNNITVSIDFQEMTSGLGESYTSQYYESYSNYRSLLANNQVLSENDNLALAYLPNTAGNPANGNSTGNSMLLAAPLLRALGQTGDTGYLTSNHQTDGTFDGVILLNTSICNLSRSGAQNSNNYDLEAVAGHEIDEVLGIGGTGSTLSLKVPYTGQAAPTGSVGSTDIYRYSGIGVRSFTLNPSVATYFSFNGGFSNLVYFDQNDDGSDFGDWGNGTPNSSGVGNNPPQIQDAHGDPGVDVNIGANELAALDVVGYNLTAAGAAAEEYAPILGTAPQPATAPEGTVIADQATVDEGDNPTGTVTFKLYNNSSASGTPLFTDTETLSGGVATSDGYTPTASGTYYWVANYNGNSDNAVVNSGPAAEPVTVTPFTAASFIVTNTQDSGTGSLRQAIIDANLENQPQNITFDIPTTDPNYRNAVFTISPQSSLPTITDPDVTIDGSTEPNSATLNGGRPVIFLNGASQNINGLVFSAGSDEVNDLGVDNFAGTLFGGGVVFSGAGAGGDSVQNCLIGIGPAGFAASAGNTVGVSILNAGTNFVGNDVIGFNIDGILVLSGTGNYIYDDSIGISSAYSAPNGTGILLTGPANVVYDNQIDDNTGDGISISGSGSTGNTVQDNTIGVEPATGTNVSGYLAAPNGGDGIQIFSGADNNLIGGNGNTSSTYANLIAGNSGNGIEIDGSSGNAIQYNTIGYATEHYFINGSHTVNNPNGGAGVYLNDAATGNTIGGVSGEGNTISGNDSSGVHIVDDASSGNTIEGNYIGTDSAGDSIGNGGGLYVHGDSETITANVISGNSYSGVNLAGVSNTVSNNFIGTNPAGTAAVPNAQQGVYITGNSNVVNENTISGNDQQGVMINGSSYNTISGNSIGLNGSYSAALPNDLEGVLVTGTLNTISGDVIGGNLEAGIDLEGNSNTVYYCYVGINTSGGAVSNGTEGIYIDSSGNLIGGTSYATAGNDISGNTDGNGYGILLDTSAATGNYVEGNYIGTNLTGTGAVGNAIGVVIQNGASGNYIGNSSIDVGNVISCNSEGGINFTTSAGANNLVTSNYIGTNAAGTAFVGDQADGVVVNAPNEIIGGTTAAARNVLSGNVGTIYASGVVVSGIGSDTIEGNYIGTNAAGTAAVPNEVGVYVYGGATNVGIYGNVISASADFGVWLSGSSSTSSVVQGNLMGTDYTGTKPIGNQTGIFIAGDDSTIGGSASGQGNTVDFNTAGGIDINQSTDASIADCTIYDNVGYGVENDQNLSIYNSTITGTAAGTIGIQDLPGDGIVNGGSALSIYDSTIAVNGLGIDETASNAILENTIVAQNTTGDITGAIASTSTYNLVGNGTGLTGISNGVGHNQIGTSASPINAMLGSLASNGGSTETMLPASSSPVLNAGIGVSFLSTDQRGDPRPTSGAVDIGALQIQTQGQNVSISGPAIYLRLATDGQTLDIYDNNTGSGTPAETYSLADVSTLAVSGASSGDSQLTVDYTNGTPIPGDGGFNYNGLGSGNTLEIIGAAGTNEMQIEANTFDFGTSFGYYSDVQSRIADPRNGTGPLDIGSNQTVSFPVAPTGGGFLDRTISSLILNTDATLIVPTATTRQSDRTLLIIEAATFNTGATLDLGGNDADFTSTPLSTVNGWVETGYNNGSWTGSGIASSFAAANSDHLTALGVIQNNQGGSALFSASDQFDGVTPGVSDVLVKYTYYGDANLDGKVDATDYSRIDNGYLNHLTGWFNGDFNYDGLINGSDYTLIDNAFNMQGASLAAQIATATVRAVKPASAPVQQSMTDAPVAMPASLFARAQIAIDSDPASKAGNPLRTAQASHPTTLSQDTVPVTWEQSSPSTSSDVVDNLFATGLDDWLGIFSKTSIKA